MKRSKMVAVALSIVALPLFSADKYWTGAANASAAAADNWCDDAELTVVSTVAPADGDDIHLTSGTAAMTWNLDIYVNSWEQDGYNGTVTFKTGKKNGKTSTINGYSDDSGETRILKVTNDIVFNTGTWTGTAQPTLTASDTAWKNGMGVYRILVEAGGDVTIGTGATVNLKGKGFILHQGPGGASTYGCAAHGGSGSYFNFNKGNTTNCYGIVSGPITIGSGGRNSVGGGAIKIVAQGDMAFNGTIDVSGSDSAPYYTGSGGSIFLTAASLTGNGMLNANGGCGTDTVYAGGGGGGRIAIILTGTGASFSSFTGTVKAKLGGKTGSSGYGDGSGGTIYIEEKADGAKCGTLIIDGCEGGFASNKVSYGQTTILSSSIFDVTPKKIVFRPEAKAKLDLGMTYDLPEIVQETDPSLTVMGGLEIGSTTTVRLINGMPDVPLLLHSSGATISVGADGNETLVVGSGQKLYVDARAQVNGSVRVANGGTISHTSSSSTRMDLNIAGDFTVDSGGIVTANGRGDETKGQTSNFGGAYGGRAFNGRQCCYGSIRRPADYGSAGYGTGAGNGGGAIRITASGAMTINGTVVCNGSTASYRTGSGGSIWLTGASISGTGTISANGGNQNSTTNISPGGGGRIAVWLTGSGADFSEFNVDNITAYGGKYSNGMCKGGAGTVYLKTGDQAEDGGTLIIKNLRADASYTDIMSGGSAQVEPVSDFDVGEVIIADAKVCISNAIVTVNRGWRTAAGSTLTCSDSGGVLVTGLDDAYFYGNNTFSSFVCEVPGKALYFGTGESDVLSMAGRASLTLKGSAEMPLVLAPATPGSAWKMTLSPTTKYDIKHVSVSHADASSGNSVTAIASLDCGDNSNWVFSPVPVPSFSIGDNGELVFVNLNGVTEVEMPEGITSIASSAFCGENSLVSVTIPASVTNVSATAFVECSGLASIAVAEDNPYYRSENGLLLTKDGTTLVQGVNGEVIIPSCVEIIGDFAFSGCSGLMSVTIPGSVTNIGRAAFSECSSLATVRFNSFESMMRLSGLDAVYTGNNTSVIVDDFQVHCGTIPRDEVWCADKVHLIVGNVVVGFGVYLTIDYGSVVKFMPGASLSVESGGWCTARKTVFTHVDDDSIGGDVLSDGDATTPKMDDYFLSTDVICDDACEFRYRSDPRVTLCGEILADETWPGHNVYCVTGDLVIASGVALTIKPGAIVKFAAGFSLTVNSGATLNAIGTRAQPIVFTSIKDDEHGGDTNGDGDKTLPYPADWGCVLISGGNIQAKYCRFTYGSGVDGNQYGARACVFMWNGGSGTFDGCLFGGSLMDGCFAQYATFRNCIFTDCDRGLVSHSGTITALNCVATYNRIGFFSHTSPLVVRNSISSLNLESAITGDGGSRTTTNCYFGDDPRFLDAENGDYRIADNSPCVDAADATYAPETDYFGQPRVNAPDIGICEVMPRKVTSDIDLVPQSVMADAEVISGQMLTVNWTVANQGGADVDTEWRDTVSLVSENGRTVTLGDKIITKRLVAGGIMSCSAFFIVPAIAEGAWYPQVNVNSAHTVFEGALQENNVLTGETAVNVSTTTLDLSVANEGVINAGTPTVLKLAFDATNDNRMVKFDVPAGVTVTWGFGFMPASRTGGSPVQSGSINGTGGSPVQFRAPDDATDVYVVLESNTTAAYNFSTETTKMAITSVTPTTLPSSGTTTLTITGAGFSPTNEIHFVNGGVVIAPESVQYINSQCLVVSVAGAKFRANQSYALEIQGDFNTAQLDGALSVIGEKGEGEFWAEMVLPERVRAGRPTACKIKYGNSGNADISVQVLQVTLGSENQGYLTYIDSTNRVKALQFVAAGDRENAGVIRAGAEHSIDFIYIPGGKSNNRRETVLLHSSWGQDYCRDSWNSAEQYLSDMSWAATRIALIGKQSTDYGIVYERAEECREVGYNSAVRGKVHTLSGEGIDNEVVTLISHETTNHLSTVSDERGCFVFDGICSGIYTLAFQSTTNTLSISIPPISTQSAQCVYAVDMTILSNEPSLIVNFQESCFSEVSVSSIASTNNYMYITKSADDACVKFYGVPDGFYKIIGSGKSKRGVAFAEIIGGRITEIDLSPTDVCSIHGRLPSDIASGDCLLLGFFPNSEILPIEITTNSEFIIENVQIGEFSLALYIKSLDDFLWISNTVQWSESVDVSPLLQDAWDAKPLKASSIPLPQKLNAIMLKSRSVEFENHWYWTDRDWVLDRLAIATEVEKKFIELRPPNGEDEYCPHSYEKYQKNKDVGANLGQWMLTMIDLYKRTDAIELWGLWFDAAWTAAKLAMELKGQGALQLGGFRKTADEAMANWGFNGVIYAARTEIVNAGIYKGVDVGIDALFGKFDELSDVMERLKEKCSSIIVMLTSPSWDMEYVKRLNEGAHAIDDLIDEAENILNLIVATPGWNSLKGKIADKRLAEFTSGTKSWITKGKTVIGCLTAAVTVVTDFVMALNKAIERDRLLAQMREKMSPFQQVIENAEKVSQQFYPYVNCCKQCFPNPPYDPPGTNGTETVTGEDPNEMSGPLGVGNPDTERFVKPGEWMTYTVYFENVSNATAAAQEVYVTNPLSEWLDWNTFEMGEIAFGNQIDLGLSGKNGGTCEATMKGTNFIVRTTLALEENDDAGTRDACPYQAKWYLRIVDPTTDTGWPADILAGFLPPNDETFRGEGHLTYRIKVRDDAPEGIVITNKASIVFDYNDPIETDPAWWNTVAGVANVTINDGDGGEGAGAAKELVVGVPYGDALPEKPTAENPGYTFAGWFTGPNGTGRQITAESLVEADDSGVYAYWTANTYEVAFRANGGEGEMPNQTNTYDVVSCLTSNAFVFAGYKFVGWATNETGSVMYEDGAIVSNLTTEANGVVDLFAVWGDWDANFVDAEIVADEESNAIVRVHGGNNGSASSLKVYLTYNTAAAADVDLKTARVGSYPSGHAATSPVSGEEFVVSATNLKFPLTLTWEAGEIGEKVITIPIKPDKTVEGDEFFTLQLADAQGMELGEERVCTVTIHDMNGKTLKASVTPYKPKKGETVATNSVTVASGNAKGGFVSGTGEYTSGSKLTLTAEARPGWAFVGWALSGDGHAGRVTLPDDILSTKAKWQIVVTNDAEYVAVFEKIPYIRGLADTAERGKVTGSGLCAAGKKVTLKATANKNFVFVGWVRGGFIETALPGFDERLQKGAVEYVATTPSLVIDRSTKPAKDTATSTTITNVTGDATYYACFITSSEDKASIELAVNGVEMRRDEVIAPYQTNVWCGVYLEWPVAASALSEAKVKVAGLPSGLKFTDKPVTSKIGTGAAAVTVTNVLANTIYGAPTAASKVDAKTKAVKPSEVKVTVTTAGKSSQTYQIDTVVDPLPAWAQGSFAGGGFVETALPAGQVSLAVSAAGKVSGKALGDGLTYTLAAPYYSGFALDEHLSSNFFADVTASWSYKEGTKTIKTNDVVQLVVQDNDIGGVATTGGGFVETALPEWTAWQYNWKADPWKDVGKKLDKQTRTYAILSDGSFSEEDEDLTAVLGADVVGRVTLKFAASGTVSVSGEFVTGYDEKKQKYTTVKATGSATLVPVDNDHGEVFIYLTPKGLSPHTRCVTVPWPKE